MIPKRARSFPLCGIHGKNTGKMHPIQIKHFPLESLNWRKHVLAARAPVSEIFSLDHKRPVYYDGFLCFDLSWKCHLTLEKGAECRLFTSHGFARQKRLRWKTVRVWSTCWCCCCCLSWKLLKSPCNENGATNIKEKLLQASIAAK